MVFLIYTLIEGIRRNTQKYAEIRRNTQAKTPAGLLFRLAMDIRISRDWEITSTKEDIEVSNPSHKSVSIRRSLLQEEVGNTNQSNQKLKNAFGNQEASQILKIP